MKKSTSAKCPFTLEFPERFHSHRTLGDTTIVCRFSASSNSGDMIEVITDASGKCYLSQFEVAVDAAEQGRPLPLIWSGTVRDNVQPCHVLPSPLFTAEGRKCDHIEIVQVVNGIVFNACLFGRIRHADTTMTIRFSYESPTEDYVNEWAAILHSITFRSKSG